MTARNQSLASAKAEGRRHYIGRVCPKHPEFAGKRHISSRCCVACNRDQMRKRRGEDPEYFREYSRQSYLKYRGRYLEKARIRGRMRRTGMDEDTYRKLLVLQEGKCAICLRELKGKTSHADHCHEQKKPRGILCSTCNQAEGLIKRSGLSVNEFSSRLAEYLANPPAKRLLQ